MSRRIEAAALAAVAIATVSCSSEGKSSSPESVSVSPTSSTLYELQRKNLTTLVDQGLIQPDAQGIKSITLFYDPVAKGGSIRSEVCFDKNKLPSSFRVMSHEEFPRKGWLVDVSYKTSDEIDQEGCTTKTPVTNLGREDIETILIGTGNSPENAYKRMKGYRWDTNGFSPKANRIKDQTPKHPVQLRDAS